MNNKPDYQPEICATEFLNNKRPRTLFQIFFFLKACQNPYQAKQNKEFMQLRRQKKLLTSIHEALKVKSFDVLLPIMY